MATLRLLFSAVTIFVVASPLLAQVTPDRITAPKATDIARNTPPIARQPNLPASLQPRPSGAPKPKLTLDPSVTAKLGQINPSILAAQIRDKISPRVVGVAVSVRLPDGRVGSAAGGMARRAPDQAPRTMSADERISIASVSKVLTAATTLKLLRQKNLSPETPIGNWLPGGWSSHPTVRAITFGELMNHTSGIRDCLITHEALEACVAKPILPNQKVYDYENANHALLRVLISRLVGLGSIGDATPEAIAAVYIDRVNKLVLAPAGIPEATCNQSSALPALSYKSADTDPAKFFDLTTVGPGENWGDMSLYCGSQGWTLSANDLSLLMHKIFVTGTVLEIGDQLSMASKEYGIRYENQNLGFPGYGHSGYHPASWNKGEINTYAFASNTGISVGLIINSPYQGNYKADISQVFLGID